MRMSRAGQRVDGLCLRGMSFVTRRERARDGSLPMIPGDAQAIENAINGPDPNAVEFLVQYRGRHAVPGSLEGVGCAIRAPDEWIGHFRR